MKKKIFSTFCKQQKILGPIIGGSVLIVIGLIYFIPQVFQSLAIETTHEKSIKLIDSIKIIRKYYTESVVNKIKELEDNGIKINYDHDSEKNTIPLPATFVHDISKRLSDSEIYELKLYSNYPFPNRAERKLDDFAREALREISKNPQKVYNEINEIDGKYYYRVAVADRLGSQVCVDCHNNRPDTPKNDWKFNDVRGVFEVSVPVTEQFAQINEKKQHILSFVLGSLMILILYYIFLAFKREEELNNLNKTLEDKVQEAMLDNSIKTKKLEDYLNILNHYALSSRTDTDGNITEISDRFCEIIGYDKMELLGKSHNIFRHPDTPKTFFQEMWSTIEQNLEFKGTLKVLHRDGSALWFDLLIVPEFDSNGKKVGYIAYRFDITNAKKLEEQHNQMLYQSRLAQMGEMISMIAHQWRQPLASISAISSTLSIDIMLGEYKEEFFAKRLESIKELSQHLSSTIDDFRGFFKNNKSKELVSLKAIVEQSLQIIESTLMAREIDVKLCFDSDRELETYTSEMKQVVLNLLKNAEDILIEKQVEEPWISVRVYHENDCECLSIEDNAGGIEENIIHKVFDPYFSTKREKDGTGLGLYMSKIIITEHCNGVLEVKNNEHGACFTVKIPT